MELEETEKILAISPHLDDAVFSCGELIAQHAGTTVTTVFAGIPHYFPSLTQWDVASGFRSAEHAMSLRRQEDCHALEILSALPLWLDFYDSQYARTPAVDALADAMQEIIRQIGPDTVLMPAGLFHSDHELVHRALLAIRMHFPQRTWLMYEDALYRRIPGLLQSRLAELARAGIEATPVELHGKDTGRLKREAVQCYASQLRALQATVRNGYADAFAPERYWRLATPRPEDVKK